MLAAFFAGHSLNPHHVPSLCARRCASPPASRSRSRRCTQVPSRPPSRRSSSISSTRTRSRPGLPRRPTISHLGETRITFMVEPWLCCPSCASGLAAAAQRAQPSRCRVARARFVVVLFVLSPCRGYWCLHALLRCVPFPHSISCVVSVLLYHSLSRAQSLL